MGTLLDVVPGCACLFDDWWRGEGRVDPRLEVAAVAVVRAHPHHREGNRRLQQGTGNP